MKLLLLITTFCLNLSLLAEERDCLLVHFNNGSKMFFLLKDSPKVLFDNSLVSIGIEQYQFENIRKYTFGNSENIGTSISLPKEAGGNFRVENGVLYITTTEADKSVRIYTIDGKEIPISHKAAPNGLISINLSSYGCGVYLLQVGNETLKISVR